MAQIEKREKVSSGDTFEQETLFVNLGGNIMRSVTKYNSLLSKIQNTSYTEKDVILNFFMPIYKLSGNSTIYKEFKANGHKLIIENEYGKIEIRNRILTVKVETGFYTLTKASLSYRFFSMI